MKWRLSLLDYIKDPWGLASYVNVVYAVACARSGEWGSVSTLALDGPRSWQWRDAPHHWSTVVPIRADAVEHDLGLPDGILDGQLVEDIEFEYLDRVVDG